jgi:hypothetical protein
MLTEPAMAHHTFSGSFVANEIPGMIASILKDMPAMTEGGRRSAYVSLLESHKL